MAEEREILDDQVSGESQINDAEGAGLEAEAAEGVAAAEGGGSLEADVEGDEGQVAEEEETDERGVPIRNRIAELQRKLEKQAERQEALEQQLLEARQKKQQEQSEKEVNDPTNIFDSIIEDVTDDELKAEGFSDAHIKLMRRLSAASAQQVTLSAVTKADRERKQLAQMRQEMAAKRNEAVTSVTDELGDEFGPLVVKKGKGWDWNRKSALFKRASEIYVQDPSLRNTPDGEAAAARKAYLELYKEKYGRKPPAGDAGGPLKKSQKLMGRSSGGKAGGRPTHNSDGDFYRELNEKEFEGLDPTDKNKYLVRSVTEGWNKEK